MSEYIVPMQAVGQEIQEIDTQDSLALAYIPLDGELKRILEDGDLRFLSHELRRNDLFPGLVDLSLMRENSNLLILGRFRGSYSKYASMYDIVRAIGLYAYLKANNCLDYSLQGEGYSSLS